MGSVFTICRGFPGYAEKVWGCVPVTLGTGVMGRSPLRPPGAYGTNGEGPY